MPQRIKLMPLNAERLKQLREKAGLSQEALGQVCGISHRTVGRYEQGKTDPEAEILARIAKALGISMDYLVGLTDDPHHYLAKADLSQDEGKLITASRSGDFKVALDLLYQKISKEIQPKLVIPRRKPKVE